MVLPGFRETATRRLIRWEKCRLSRCCCVRTLLSGALGTFLPSSTQSGVLHVDLLILCLDHEPSKVFTSSFVHSTSVLLIPSLQHRYFGIKPSNSSLFGYGFLSKTIAELRTKLEDYDLSTDGRKHRLGARLVLTAIDWLDGH